ncbi:MAG: hypothetical protein QY321_00355 [Patescibacteria group bacterium]|nr:MAG: hypothetical protein QY321_00355 [Patescibacteria group bacterium]
MRKRKIALILTVILLVISVFAGFSEGFQKTLENLLPLNKGSFAAFLIVGVLGFLVIAQIYMWRKKTMQTLLSPFTKNSLEDALENAFTSLNVFGFEKYKKNGLDIVLKQFLVEKFRRKLDEVPMLHLGFFYNNFFNYYNLELNKEYDQIKEMFNEVVIEKVYDLLVTSPSGFTNWVQLLIQGKGFEEETDGTSPNYSFNKLMFSIVPQIPESEGTEDYPPFNKLMEAFDVINTPQEIRDEVCYKLVYYFCANGYAKDTAYIKQLVQE